MKLKEFQTRYQALDIWGERFHNQASILEHGWNEFKSDKRIKKEKPLRAEDMVSPELLKRLEKGYNAEDEESEETDEEIMEEFPTMPSQSVYEMMELIPPQAEKLAQLLKAKESMKTLSAKEKERVKQHIIEEIAKLRATPEFDKAETYMYELETIMKTCEKFQKHFNLSCDDDLPVGAYLRSQKDLELLNKAIERDFAGPLSEKQRQERNAKWEPIAVDFFLTMWEILSREKTSPLYRNDIITANVAVDPVSGIRNVNLIIPVSRGDGYAPQSKLWKSFLPKLKRDVESFWQGTYKEQDGTVVRISTKVVEAVGEKSLKIHLAKSDAGYAHFDIGANQVVMKRYIQQSNSEFNSKVIVHEMGHVLGFPDRYYSYLDESTCSIAWHVNVPDDIMSMFPAEAPETLHLKQIYETYGKTPSVNSNELVDVIIGE